MNSLKKTTSLSVKQKKEAKQWLKDSQFYCSAEKNIESEINIDIPFKYKDYDSKFQKEHYEFIPMSFSDSCLSNNITTDIDMKPSALVKKYFDSKWLEAGMKYIMGLKPAQLNLLRVYTHKGDSLINGYLRFGVTKRKDYDHDYEGTLNVLTAYLFLINSDDNVTNKKKKKSLRSIKNYVDDNYPTLSKDVKLVVTALQTLADEIKSIISNAPKNTKAVVLYRGVCSIQFKAGDAYNANSFLSTSLSISRSSSFIEFCKAPVPNYYMLRILVPPGTAMIPLISVSEFPDELEILLNVESTLAIGKIFEERPFENSFYYMLMKNIRKDPDLKKVKYKVVSCKYLS